MRLKVNLLAIICVLAVVMLLGLQAYWIRNYYQVIKKNFETEVNLAFEDAFKKEFSNRADLIQENIKKKLLDSNYFRITSKLGKEGEVIYDVSESKKPNDKFSKSFSTVSINELITPKNRVQLTEKVAGHFASMLRNEDLNNHIIYYRTQELGKYMFEQTKKFEFDTALLRPILDRYLFERSIHVPYQFYATSKDSTTNKSTFSKELTEQFPIITRALPTYKNSAGQNYVRVLFYNPTSYMMSNLTGIFICSLFLVTLLTLCLYYLFKRLAQEKKLSQIKNDFISHITHEFKTPIATASLAVEQLQDAEVRQNEEKTLRYLTYAKNELSKISQLTDKILKISLFEKGQDHIQKEPIQLNQVFTEIINLFNLTSPDAKITFSNSSAIHTISVDRTQFQHAISNVIDNAIKYGSQKVEVKIDCYLQDSFLITEIKDNGPGIDKGDLPFIFDKFYRGKNDFKKDVKGYGLGLNYVQQIVNSHQGWSKIISTATGTTLNLAWPIS